MPALRGIWLHLNAVAQQGSYLAAERFPERGFGKLFQIIHRRGHVWNHERVWRVYCLMKLN